MTEEDQTPQAIKLQHTWVLYYDEQTQQRTQQQQNDYSDRLKPLGTFSTVQEFWRYWNNLHVADFPLNSNLRIFKQGIHPSWEDPNNALGGKWLIDVVQHKSTQAFMLTVLAMIGEQFAHSDELCGAVFSVRGVGNRINVWNKNAHDKQILERCEEELKAVLQPVKINVFRYQPHRIDVQPPKKEAQPSKTSLAAAVATNSSAEAPIAGGATDPPKSKSSSDLLAVPASGRAALSSSQGDEDDFGSPFIELSAELSEKQKLEDSTSSSGTADSPAPMLSKHRKTLSMSALPSSSALQQSGDGSIQLSSIATLDAAAMKRRLRRRGGRRSSSGNHSAAISLALGTISGESSAEPSPRDPLTPSSSSENLFAAQTAAPSSSSSQQQLQQIDQIMTPSITERKYLQRKRNSVDRSKKHSRNNSDNDASEGKRRLYSRPSRENLHGDSKKRSAVSAFWRSFLIFFFAAFIVIIAVGLISQYSCEYLHILCT